MALQSIAWRDNCLVLLNQTLLPSKIEYLYCRDYRTVANAIRRLEVRGAPAIGAAAAFGLVLGAHEIADCSRTFWEDFAKIAEELQQTRPTAINLFWAINRMTQVANQYKAAGDIHGALIALEREAIMIMNEDKEINCRIAENGACLFSGRSVAVLTHCNAGALATVAYGTALGVIRKAWSAGNITRVYADETRPLLQGARLTAWELMQAGIPVTLITDSMAGWVMKNNMVQAIIVGADRIALNGDVANKIGTYSLAVLAQNHNIPFFVAAPLSTFDFTIKTGDSIPIEERSGQEIVNFGGTIIAPQEVEVYNPAFDVTPNNLITAIITERGIIKAPFTETIAQISKERGGK